MHIRVFIGLAFLLSLSLAKAEVPAPTWDEFCPPEYMNAQFQQSHYSKGKNALLAATYVGIPLAIFNQNKHEKLETENYWYQRRQAFEKELKTCQASNDQLVVSCYMQIRQIESGKNNQWQVNQEIKSLKRQVHNNTFDKN